VPNELIEFSVQSVTEGIDALGRVTIHLRYQERLFVGQASDTDIVVASAYAYVNALNRLYSYWQKQLSSEPRERVSIFAEIPNF
jgi:2-isopropylmalate synthase